MQEEDKRQNAWEVTMKVLVGRSGVKREKKKRGEKDWAEIIYMVAVKFR